MKNNLNLCALIALFYITSIFSLENNTLNTSNTSFEKSIENIIETKINEELQQLQSKGAPDNGLRLPPKPQQGTINVPVKKVPRVETIKEDAKKAFERAFNDEEFEAENLLKEFKGNLNNPNFKAQINKELQQIYEEAQKAQPYIKDFKLGLEKVKSEYAKLLTRTTISESINDFIISAINFAEKTTMSKNLRDIALINSLQNALAAIIDFINKLYLNKNNLGTAITTADINKLKLVLKNGFDNLYDFAGRNSSELNTLIQKASLIQPQDAIHFETNIIEDNFRNKTIETTNNRK